jgi:hypothetical protein
MSQSLTNDSISSKSNTIIIEVTEPQNHGVGAKKYTDYLVKTRVIVQFLYNFKLMFNLNCFH